MIFCLYDLSIVKSGVLKAPTIIILLSISPFIYVSICLIYLGSPMSGHVYLLLLYLLYELTPLPLYDDWPPLSLAKIFRLKSILYDLNLGIFATFWFPFVRDIFFHLFTWRVCVSFTLKWVFCRQHISWVFFFFCPFSHSMVFDWQI